MNTTKITAAIPNFNKARIASLIVIINVSNFHGYKLQSNDIWLNSPAIPSIATNTAIINPAPLKFLNTSFQALELVPALFRTAVIPIPIKNISNTIVSNCPIGITFICILTTSLYSIAFVMLSRLLASYSYLSFLKRFYIVFYNL